MTARGQEVPTGCQAIYVFVTDKPVARTTELIAAGAAYADYDEDGNLVGIELLVPAVAISVDGVDGSVWRIGDS